MGTREGSPSLADERRAKSGLSAPRLLLAVGVTTLFASTCPPPEVVVGAVRSDRLCRTCWDSRRDNPLVQGTVALQTTRRGSDSFDEGAERNSAGFVYENLRVTASVKGDDRVGASGLSLIPNPASFGSWGVTEAAPTVLLPWELHGIELGYGVSEAVIARDGALGAHTIAPQSPVKVALAPTVMLVPVQVVRVIPDNPDAPFAANLAKFTKGVQKKYWDDRWDVDTVNFPEPGVPFKGSAHAVNATVLPWDSADEIWDQCRIQFRMITCPGSKEGCPDLKVSEPAQVAATSCIEGRSPEASKNWTDAEALPGVNRDLPIITFTWRVTKADCSILDVAKGGRAAMGFGVTPGAGTGDLTLAHELGHVLGLNDFKDCRGDGRQLMCAQDGEQTRKIRAEDCVKARSNAARYVKRQWGVAVNP